MSYCYRECYLHVPCIDEKDAKDIASFIDMIINGDNKPIASYYTHVFVDDSRKWFVEIELKEPYAYTGQDTDLEDLCKCIYRRTGRILDGYVLDESDDGRRYRGEFKFDCKLHFESLDVDPELTNAQIADLRRIAEDKFKKDPIKVVCPHCKEEHMVVANMVKIADVSFSCFMEGGQPCINFEDGRIEGDFEYICDGCEEVIARDAYELEELIKGDKR